MANGKWWPAEVWCHKCGTQMVERVTKSKKGNLMERNCPFCKVGNKWFLTHIEEHK